MCDLRAAAADFAAHAGFAGVGLDDIRACVTEAVTNCVVHAFRDGRTVGTVTLSATTHPDAVVFVVSDDGMGFRPRTDSPGLGLGVAMIRAMTESMAVGASDSGGTAVSMSFRRDRDGASVDQSVRG